MTRPAEPIPASPALPRLPTQDDLPCEEGDERAWLVHLPTQDELPSDDGMPMETERHRVQMELLIRALAPWAEARGDVVVGGNQFLYFSSARLKSADFRGPDVYVVTGVPRGERKSWVVWEEGKGPDVVIELISESTAAADKGSKKQIYQDQLRVPDYYWFDPFDPSDRAGFGLRGRAYVPLPRDADGNLPVPSLGLKLGLWEGAYLGIDTLWLRWRDDQGRLLLLPEEREEHRADEEKRRADEAQRLAEHAKT